MTPARIDCCAALFAASTAAAGCVTLASPKHAHADQLIGIVEEPRSGLLRIATITHGTVDIATDRATSYVKWVTHQPWTVDQFVNARSVRIGRCVKVTAREGQARVAKLIEVSLDRPGAIDDPCKRIR